VIKTAKKIYWQSPDSTSITKVEISHAETQFGSYTVASTINATSDGTAKTSSNTWVTNYTDSSGLRSYWYRIRFYDGTNYSDYSDSITSDEPPKLCTIDEVKNTIDCTGRFTDDDIYKAIDENDALIYMECGTPLASSLSDMGKIDSTVQELYYVGEEDIYRVDRVFYGTTTKTELFPDDQFMTNERYGMIKIITTGTYAVTLDETKEIEIRYVPKIFNKLCVYRTIQTLLEKLDMTVNTTTSKELDIIKQKVNNVENILAHRIGVQISSDLANYDRVYGCNKKLVIQDHFKNRVMASTGLGGW